MRISLTLAAFVFIIAGTAVGQSPTTPTADSVRDTTSTALDSAFAKASITDTPSATLRPVTVTGTSQARSGYMRLESSTGTKTPTLLRDIPQAMSVINRSLISDQSMQNIGDVVRYVPGITMGQGEGNRDQPTIRGNSTTADFYVNGVRDDAQYFRDLYNVDRVEALKGPNAMIFGRGGGGGVVNRVMKEATWSPVGEVTLQGGSYVNRRGSVDIGTTVNDLLATRFNGLYENSRTFRDNVWMRRQGINPTFSIGAPGDRTRIRVGYENFLDYRTADRGIPSYGTEPLATDVTTFFGSPETNFSRTRVSAASLGATRVLSSSLTLNNRAQLAWYDKAYQNVLPGAVTSDGTSVSLSAYNNAHRRANIFNQTDLTYLTRSGPIAHTFLLGAEFGRQITDNFRNTGYFNDSATTLIVPVAAPTTLVPVSFRQNATDADNHVKATTRSIYVQDQLDLTEYVKLITGVRYESFSLRYHDNRSGATLTRNDAMPSPRFGLVIKPSEEASLYASYSISYLPSSGDQFSSLTNVTEALDPERFINIEAGAKWDVADRLALTVAVYRLDRTNTRAPSPDDPSITVQTGRQQSRGYELGITGQPTTAWSIAGGFTRQEAFITSTTAAAPSGTTVPLVPAATLSLWNKYQLVPGFALALGAVRQADMYAAVSNTVKLPAFTRFDAAAYYTLPGNIAAQVNIENILNAIYYPLANGNNNITPGAPRSLRATFITHF
ncbi:MAG TPA: TonB-dependent siderophore receptor [Gemmatimonadaceae bacterium]|nr:TonB-dependent siderophore receptor [Gemmatimonadaceae bacterium]